jgi:hypothetical protein
MEVSPIRDPKNFVPHNLPAYLRAIGLAIKRGESQFHSKMSNPLEVGDGLFSFDHQL